MSEWHQGETFDTPPPRFDDFFNALKGARMTMCEECGAQVAREDVDFHSKWHAHINRLIDIAAGNYDRDEGRSGVAAAFLAFRDGLKGVGR